MCLHIWVGAEIRGWYFREETACGNIMAVVQSMTYSRQFGWFDGVWVVCRVKARGHQVNGFQGQQLFSSKACHALSGCRSPHHVLSGCGVLTNLVNELHKTKETVHRF